jgi:hypothetical protein
LGRETAGAATLKFLTQRRNDATTRQGLSKKLAPVGTAGNHAASRHIRKFHGVRARTDSLRRRVVALQNGREGADEFQFPN